MVGKDGKWIKQRKRLSAKVRAELDARAEEAARRKGQREAKRRTAQLTAQHARFLAKLKAKRRRRHYDTCSKMDCRWCDHYGLPKKSDRRPNPNAKRSRPRMRPLASRLSWPNGDPFGDL